MNNWDFSVPADDFPEPMLLVSPDGEVLAINRAAREDFGLGAGYPATHLCDLVADAGEKVMAFVRLCSSTRDAVPGALSFRTPAGILDCRCDGHRTADGLVYLRCRPKDMSNQAFTVLNEKIAELAREIAIRMRTEEQLQELLKSREILIQELHHRIRNSIQMAISLAGLQMRQATDGATREQFLKHSNRLKAIGLVYRTLYREQDFTRLDISDFVSDLCSELRRACCKSDISFSIEVDATLLSLDQAVPFALIVNELVTNAVKYAYPAGMHGIIRVQFESAQDGSFAVQVADEGVGLPPGFDPATTKSLGMRMVSALLGQVGAELSCASGSGGTNFTISAAG